MASLSRKRARRTVRERDAQYAITILIKTYILHVLNLRLLENILYIRYYILNRKHYTYVLIINNAYKYAKQMKYNYYS